MEINSGNILKSVVELVLQEQNLFKKQIDIMQKFENAENLGLADEMTKIALNGSRLDFKIRQHFAKKAIVMSMVVSKNENFFYN